MTYLRRPRKDGNDKPKVIRCKSGRNVLDDETLMVKLPAPVAVNADLRDCETKGTENE